ncbi:MAG: hypothetical protein HQL73_07585 [Magnetococcales bacterium]|nr:hypothetical protein [Magnetococcales bacterium]
MKKILSVIVAAVCTVGVSAVASAQCGSPMDCGYCSKDYVTVRRTLNEAENQKVIWPKGVEVRGKVEFQELTQVPMRPQSDWVNRAHGLGHSSADVFVVTTGYPASAYSNF